MTLLLSGFLVPEPILIPVSGASVKDWNSESFWYEPWGSSGVHKGIDIFAAQDTALLSTSHAVVLFQGRIAKGGNVVLTLGPKWRLHYYAHLSKVDVKLFEPIRAGSKIGAVGDSGNAKGKPPHLHYSLVTLLPYPWRITQESQGWKKMFYLDPGKYLSYGE